MTQSQSAKKPTGTVNIWNASLANDHGHAMATPLKKKTLDPRRRATYCIACSSIPVHSTAQAQSHSDPINLNRRFSVRAC
eukprot:scaffold33534_cov103-Skeletonema_dohrnii-CCMP3373.AAC.1